MNRHFRGSFTYAVHLALANTRPAIEQIQAWAEENDIRFTAQPWDDGNFLLFGFTNEADANAVEQHFRALIEDRDD